MLLTYKSKCVYPEARAPYPVALAATATKQWGAGEWWCLGSDAGVEVDEEGEAEGEAERGGEFVAVGRPSGQKEAGAQEGGQQQLGQKPVGATGLGLIAQQDPHRAGCPQGV